MDEMPLNDPVKQYSDLLITVKESMTMITPTLINEWIEWAKDQGYYLE